MGQTQTKPPLVCSAVQWQLSTATALRFPSSDEVEAALLSAPSTAALGKDVCHIIASYCPCLLDAALITSSGLILPLSFPSTSLPLYLRPPLPSLASCCVLLPPSSVAFGLSDSSPSSLKRTDRRRAVVHIYDAHSLTLSHSLFFPYQREFLSPHPSVSSLLLLPPPFPLPLSASTLLAGVDDVGHVCVWHWPTGELLYTFLARPPVFYASSTLCALPYGRLALLLSGCPGPQHSASRLHVFDLIAERTYCAVDSDLHSQQVFPLTLFFPSPLLPSSLQGGQTSPITASAAKAKSLPYSLCSNDSLSRWHISHAHEAIEVRPVLLPPLPTPSSSQSSASFSPPLPSFLSTSSTSWQSLGHSNPAHSYGYRWRHRCSALRADPQGRVAHVEGEVDTVRVWIGHHTDRLYTAFIEFVHDDADDGAPTDTDDGADEEKQPSGGAEEGRRAPMARPPLASAPILIPRLPFAVPPMLLYQRQPRQRRTPPNLHVSAAWTPSGLLLISAHHPGAKGAVGRGRVVTAWRLMREKAGDAVQAKCVFVKRMKGADMGHLLSTDAPSKIAQRIKGAKQFFLG